MIPNIVQIGFGFLVVFMMFAYLITFYKVESYRKKYRIFILIWLGVTGILGSNKFFEDFSTMPPRVPIFVLLFVLSLVVMGIALYKERAWPKIQQFHLILFQAFRIPVEILLLILARHSLLPIEMTYEGRNFDILIGIAALPLAWWVRKKGEKKSRDLIIVWNVAGFLMLSNVVNTAMLAAPYPFQVYKLGIDSFVIGYFPIIWLPLFLVPTAYFFHIVSLVKTRYAE